MEDPKNNELEAQESGFYELNECDYITAACNAISAFEGIDVYTEELIQMKERVIERGFYIIDKCIHELYLSLKSEDE